MLNRLRVRLTVVCAASTAVVLIIAMFMTLYFSVRQLMIQQHTAFLNQVKTVIYYLSIEPIIDRAWIKNYELNNKLIILIETPKHMLLQSMRSADELALIERAKELVHSEYSSGFNMFLNASSQPSINTFTLDNDYRVAIFSLSTPRGILNVTILKDLTDELNASNRVKIIYIVSVIIAITCLALFSHYFIKWAVKPIKENQERQSEFIAAASHELRSPLAVMQSSAGVITNTSDLSVIQLYANNINNECVRLTRLTSDLLSIVAADSNKLALEFDNADPDTILITAHDRFVQLAKSKGMAIQVILEDDVVYERAKCDFDRIVQSLSILIDNAISHNTVPCNITLQCHQNKKYTRFIVSDDGIGIPSHLQNRIFDKFFRCDKSRTSKEHYGLGLSIAREIAYLHNGNLTCRQPQVGTGVEFVLSIGHM